jgi:hypothetical protein
VPKIYFYSSGSRPIIAISHGHFSKCQRYTFTIQVWSRETKGSALKIWSHAVY